MTGRSSLSARARAGRWRAPRRAVSALFVVAAMAMSLGVTACGGDDKEKSKAAEPVELSFYWWGSTERAEMTAKVLDLYTQRHPNVTFKTKWLAYKDYFDALNKSTADGTAPDVFQIDDNYLTEHVDRGMTLDLTDYANSKKIDLRAFPPSLVAYGNVRNRLHGVASGENTPSMVYDKTVARKYGLGEPQIGWTYEQLLSWASTITAKSEKSVIGSAPPAGSYIAFWLWLRSQGKELYNGSAPGFTEDDVARWFDMWAAAQRSTIPMKDRAANGVTDPTKQPLVLKTAATAFVWSNQLSNLQALTDHELGITAFPGNPQAQWARASLFWSVYKGSKHPDVAADVINFLVNDPEAGALQGTDRGLPSNRTVLANIAPSLPQPMQQALAFEKEISSMFGTAPPPPPKGHPKVVTLLTEISNRVLFDNLDTRQAANEFVTQVKQLLSS